MAKVQVKTNESSNPKENPHIGFVIAIVSLIASFVLFFGWEIFGNEMVLQIVASGCLVIGLCGFGAEITNYTKDDGALEAGIGLSFTFFILMFKAAVPGTPNLVVLGFILFGLLFIGVSIARLFPLKKINKPNNIQNENTPLLNKIKYIIIAGQILGLVVNIVNFIRLFI
ncbi:hypothetical protein ACTXGU_00205 [Niallia sp. 01092]|uniref:hypothetical protein n=1 Tax=Niallia sp. 01092 TaxID=3457759 RepID=UPI003FD4A24A